PIFARDDVRLGRLVLWWRRTELLQPGVDFGEAWPKGDRRMQHLPGQILQLEPYMHQFFVVTPVLVDLPFQLIDAGGYFLQRFLLVGNERTGATLHRPCRRGRNKCHTQDSYGQGEKQKAEGPHRQRKAVQWRRLVGKAALPDALN